MLSSLRSLHVTAQLREIIAKLYSKTAALSIDCAELFLTYQAQASLVNQFFTIRYKRSSLVKISTSITSDGRLQLLWLNLPPIYPFIRFHGMPVWFAVAPPSSPSYCILLKVLSHFSILEPILFADSSIYLTKILNDIPKYIFLCYFFLDTMHVTKTFFKLYTAKKNC